MELIAEIGPADGDLEYAYEACTAAKESGFDWVKGQLFDRDKLVTPTAPSYGHSEITTPATQYEAFEKQLSYDEWEQVAWHCRQIDIGFFASVWDYDAIEFCEDIGVERYKIGSGDITYKPLIEAVASTNKLVVISTGASTEQEIGQAVSWVGASPLVLLACSLSYPCPDDQANMARVWTLRDRFGVPVGYSDHTYGTGALAVAEYLEAVMWEKHFTVRPGTGGDHDFAVTPVGMAERDQGSVELLGSPRLEPSPREQAALMGARRSLVLSRDLAEGTVLKSADLTALRPGWGLSPALADDFVGRTLSRDKKKHSMITYADI